MKYSRATGIIILAGLILVQLACDATRRGSSRADKTIMDAEKPAVDSSYVPEILELYRAKRYEDFQTAMADGKENVRKISLYGKKIGTLSNDIGMFPYLATLDVAHNELTELPEAMSELHYLQGLYVNGNRLTEFPPQLFLLPLLARLDLSENQISQIPPEIKKMDQLDFLTLEANQIMSIPVELYELKQLTALNLAANGLSTLPEGISGMTALEKLDISGNQLTELPEDLVNMGSHLTELSIQGNRIPREKVDWLIEAMPSTKIRF
jgi:Leucine-rich repeat (LRR) protein